MKKELKYWQLAGFFFTGALGVFLHFAYELSGNNTLAAAFASINESTFQHLKLLFFPSLVFALIESRFIRREDFWCIKLKGTLLGLLLIPVIFYTCTGIFGATPDWYNIGIYFIAAAVQYIYEYRRFLREKPCRLSSDLSFALLCLAAVVFVLLTYYPIDLPFFENPEK